MKSSRTVCFLFIIFGAKLGLYESRATQREEKPNTRQRSSLDPSTGTVQSHRTLSSERVVQIHSVASGLPLRVNPANHNIDVTFDRESIATLFEVVSAKTINKRFGPHQRAIRSMINVNQFICISKNKQIKLGSFSRRCVFDMRREGSFRVFEGPQGRLEINMPPHNRVNSAERSHLFSVRPASWSVKALVTDLTADLFKTKAALHEVMWKRLDNDQPIVIINPLSGKRLGLTLEVTGTEAVHAALEDSKNWDEKIENLPFMRTLDIVQNFTT